MESFAILNNNSKLNATPSSTHLHYNVQHHDLISDTLPNFIKEKAPNQKGKGTNYKKGPMSNPTESTHKHKPTNGGHYWFGDLKVFPRFATSRGQPHMGR